MSRFSFVGTGLTRGAACVVAIAALVTIVYWPGVYGFWGRDDFGVLAFVRLLGSPWPLFVHDHFSAPGAVFRPLGFASMWLGEAVLGNGYRAHAITDLALHIGVSLALFGVMRRSHIPDVIALLCVLLFALHPAAIGTALWWSARFDLLATLFVLLALYAAISYRESGGIWMLTATLVSAFAAMLSKEIGLIAIAAQSLLWLRWAWTEPADRARAMRAVALSWLCALIFLVWRWAVLGTPSSNVTAMIPLGSAIARGLVAWMQQIVGYFAFWARLEVAQRIVLMGALSFSLAAIIVVAIRDHLRFVWGLRGDVILCGACMLILPALLQAPVAAFALPISGDASAVETAMQSRLYYLGIAGACLTIAAVLTVLRNVSGAKFRLGFFAVLVPVVAIFAWTSHKTAQAFSRRSVVISGVAREAVSALAQITLPPSHCHVMFLDVEPESEWNTYVSMDSVVKALYPDLDRVKHCWFHDNYGTPMNLQAAPAVPADATPYVPLEVDGRRQPWRVVGDVVITYLRPPAIVEPRELARLIFLRYRDGRFENVSADVVSGRLAVDLE